jgi:hypothetical protein
MMFETMPFHLSEDGVGGVIYLTSGASNRATNHSLLIDGGWTAH